MEKVLIVDDDEDLRSVVSDVLREEGFVVTEAPDGPAGLKAFKKEPPHAVLLDLNMPHMDGIETLRQLRKIDPSVPVIILTAYGDIKTAVEAIKLGAYDFATKPPEFDQLILTLRRAVEKRLLQLEVEKADTALKSSLEHIFGKSRSMKAVTEQIRQVSPTDFSVVIQGETGTGKSVIASVIHDMSKRAGKPLVSVDIGLIPDHLVESELFGYKKGAFTGAERDKAGYLETAHEGTVFIDELENMSAQIQGKLLSFFEKKKIYPLGGTTPVNADVRILTATNKDIRECVAKKEFREDLFYRLGEFIITIPPLRERVDDIPFFAKKFLYEASAELDRQIRDVDADAIDLLTSHRWPGNLRELRNVMKKATLLTDGDVIDRKCLQPLIQGGSGTAPARSFQSLKDSVKETEKNIIQEVLQRTGSKTKTAEILNISYRSLFDKMREYGIE